MGSAGSARPEVTVVEAGSESSEDPDFEPGIVSLSVACAFKVLQAKPQTQRMLNFGHFAAIDKSTCRCQGT